MKVYVICVKQSGTPYPISCGGKTAAWPTKEIAEETISHIQKTDFEYCNTRDGLFVDTIECSEALLDVAGFYLCED
jgi:hypothetical protein